MPVVGASSPLRLELATLRNVVQLIIFHGNTDGGKVRFAMKVHSRRRMETTDSSDGKREERTKFNCMKLEKGTTLQANYNLEISTAKKDKNVNLW